MVSDAKTLENIILQGLHDATVRVEDLRGDGEPHFAAHVTSPSFDGKTRVQQHQMVYALLKDSPDMNFEMLTLRTSLPGK